MINDLLNAVRAHAQMSVGEKVTHRVGQITAYDPNKYAVKVKMWPDTQESLGWIPLASTYIGAGWGLVAGPSIGDQVIVAFDREDQDAGVVVGRFFTDVEQPPAAPSGEFWVVHKSGSSIKITNDGKVTVTDKAGSTIVMNGDNTGTATFSGGMTINANVQVNGTLKASGDITDNSSTNTRTMAGMRTVYNSHTHPVVNVQTGGSTVTSNVPNQLE